MILIKKLPGITFISFIKDYASAVKSSSSVLATSSSPASSTLTLPALAAAKSHFRDVPSSAFEPVALGCQELLTYVQQFYLLCKFRYQNLVQG